MDENKEVKNNNANTEVQPNNKATETTPNQDTGKKEVPLHEVLKARKQRNEAREQIEANKEYVELAKRLESISGKSLSQLRAELDSRVNQTQTTQTPKVDHNTSKLEQQLLETNKKLAKYEMQREFDSIVREEKYRTAREIRDDIIDFAIEKGLPVKNAIYAMVGDQINQDAAKLQGTQGSTQNKTNLANMVNSGGTTSAGYQPNEKSEANAQKVKMDVVEYNLMKNGTPEEIREYYLKKAKAK